MLVASHISRVLVVPASTVSPQLESCGLAMLSVESGAQRMGWFRKLGHAVQWYLSTHQTAQKKQQMEGGRGGGGVRVCIGLLSSLLKLKPLETWLIGTPELQDLSCSSSGVGQLRSVQSYFYPDYLDTLLTI